MQSLKSFLSDLFAAAMPIAGNPSKCNAGDAAKTLFFTVMGTDDSIKNMGVVAEVVDKEYPPFAKEKLFRRFAVIKTAE